MTAPTSRAIPLQILSEPAAPPASLQEGAKQLGGDKIGRSPVQFADAPVLRKPSWIRVRIPSGNAVATLKARLRENRLVTVCEEASCPNIHECFGHGTATFMILGEVCTRRCSFCYVAKSARNTSPLIFSRRPLNRALLARTNSGRTKSSA